MLELITWLEAHPVTVGILSSIALIIVAWTAGLFRFVYQRVRRPKVRIVPEGSLMVLQPLQREDLPGPGTVAAFLLNVTLINPSESKVVLRGFQLSFRALAWSVRMRQRLRYVPLPSRPTQVTRLGKLEHAVWFQNLPGQDRVVDGRLAAKEMESAWVLFVSATWGDHSPRADGGAVKLKLEAHFTDGRSVSDSREVRVAELSELEALVPGARALLADDGWWNTSVAIR